MPRKKKTEQEVADESIMENSQTDSEMEETSPFPQTGTEDSENTLNSEQPGEPDESDESLSSEKTPVLQTGTENEEKTDKDQEASSVRRPRNRENAVSARPVSPVLSIDEQLVAQTDYEKAKNDLLDLVESQKTGRILTGTIQGVERPDNNSGHSLAVIYHGEYKIIIPAEEAVELPEDTRGRSPEEIYHYLLTKRLGAEVDFIVKGLDEKAGIAVASRQEAMRAKRREYYMGTDRDGNYRIYSGVCAEARVVSVIRAGIFVDLFGLEVYIPLRELSYQRWMDAANYFQSGQRILVRVLSVDRTDRDHIRAAASVKQAGENPYEKALRRYSVGNCYVGKVSMVDMNGVFVALDGGIDCLCSYPKRGRPPRGSRVTVKVLGINHETNRIWGAITHIAAPH